MSSSSSPTTARSEPEKTLTDAARGGVDDQPVKKKKQLGVVFMGHVDAGKSTIAGQILLLSGEVDARAVEKYRRKARENKRESWYLAYIMDTDDEERARGKTVSLGRARFETEAARYTILDAPGHRAYVPHLVDGAAQADVGVLVVSARKGEFEAGFERGGQTREHVIIAKTMGVRTLVVAVNKMDSCGWARARFDEIARKLAPFLRRWGYAGAAAPLFIPIAGRTGANIATDTLVAADLAPWYSCGPSSGRSSSGRYSGKTLLGALDGADPRDEDVGDPRSLDDDDDDPVRICVSDTYAESGITHIEGKVVRGRFVDCGAAARLHVSPADAELEIQDMRAPEDPTVRVDSCSAGESVVIRTKASGGGVETGSVLSLCNDPCPRSDLFDAQIVVMDVEGVIAAGYQAVLHCHNLSVDCTIDKIIFRLEKKNDTKKKLLRPTKRRAAFFRGGDTGVVRVRLSRPVAVEAYKTCASLGRFVVRDGEATTAIGKVLRLCAEEDGDGRRRANP